MQLKNKVERERFLENYKSWELFQEVPELELKFYRYKFPNGTVIIATEYARMKLSQYVLGANYEKSTAVKYHLLLSGDDKFNKGYHITAYRFYEPSGDSKSILIEYLTKTKPEIDSPGDSNV